MVIGKLVVQETTSIVISDKPRSQITDVFGGTSFNELIEEGEYGVVGLVA
jgi:hypothetical protein